MPEQPKKSFPKKFLILPILIFLILAALFIFLVMTNRDFRKRIEQFSEPTGTKAILKNIGGSDRCEGTGPVDLTHLPMEEEDFGVVLPYGLMVGAHVTPIDHMYFGPADRNSPRDSYPVYAMADGILSEVTSRGMNVDTGEKRPVEYRLVITHTCTFLTYYDLVTSLDKTITDQAPEILTKGSSNKDIKVKAGQLIGRIGGQTLDFAVWDLEKPLTGFANPESYKIGDPWKIYTANPYDYTSDAVEKIMIEHNPRTIEPIQGKIDYDIDGKLVGNWFLEGTNGYAGLSQRQYWRDHLSVVYSYLDPNFIVISIGDWNGDEAQFGVSGNFPDPATVGVSSTPTKYELSQFNYSSPDGKNWDNMSIVKNLKGKLMDQIKGTILLQLLEPRKLKVETFPGKKASLVSSFTPQAKIFVR